MKNQIFKIYKQFILNYKKLHNNNKNILQSELYEIIILKWLNDYHILTNDEEGLSRLYKIAFISKWEAL